MIVDYSVKQYSVTLRITNNQLVESEEVYLIIRWRCEIVYVACYEYLSSTILEYDHNEAEDKSWYE